MLVIQWRLYNPANRLIPQPLVTRALQEGKQKIPQGRNSHLNLDVLDRQKKSTWILAELLWSPGH